MKNKIMLDECNFAYYEYQNERYITKETILLLYYYNNPLKTNDINILLDEHRNLFKNLKQIQTKE